MSQNTVAEEREQAVTAAMADIERIESDLGVSRSGVESIRDRLIELSSNRRLFPMSDFPAPDASAEENGFMYRLAEDRDDGFALYAQSSSGHLQTPPHNHTTWAVVVGFDGQELNRFYNRTDDGGVEEVGQHVVEAGTGVAMLPDDLHSIHIDGTALNFHCYGLALERLDARQYYSAKSGDWKPFTNVSHIREARINLPSD